MENTLANKVYIIDSFKYLVSHVGFCDAYFTEHNGWTVSINGRLFQQDFKTLNTTLYTFTCKTSIGTVTVSFLNAGAL